MARTIVTLFDDPDEARHTLDQLVYAGVRRQAIELYPNTPEEQLPRGAETTDALTSDELIALLTSAGIAAEDARRYDDAVRHGSTLLKVTADDEAVGLASGVLTHFRSADRRREARSK